MPFQMMAMETIISGIMGKLSCRSGDLHFLAAVCLALVIIMFTR